MTPGGFPHSGTPGSTLLCSSPGRFAAYAPFFGDLSLGIHRTASPTREDPSSPTGARRRPLSWPTAMRLSKSVLRASSAIRSERFVSGLCLPCSLRPLFASSLSLVRVALTISIIPRPSLRCQGRRSKKSSGSKKPLGMGVEGCYDKTLPLNLLAYRARLSFSISRTKLAHARAPRPRRLTASS